MQWAPDNKTIWFLEQGRISSVSVESKTVRQMAARAELDVDFNRVRRSEVFHQAWEFLNDNFYDPEFHGIDWAAVHTTYAPRDRGRADARRDAAVAQPHDRRDERVAHGHRRDLRSAGAGA